MPTGFAASPYTPELFLPTLPITPKVLYISEDQLIEPLDEWIASFADPVWLASTQKPDTVIKAQHDKIHTRPSEIDAAMSNLITIENGSDPTVLNPRITELRNEREWLAKQLGSLKSPERLTTEQIDLMLNERNGLTSVLSKATPPEKNTIYQALGIRLLFRPNEDLVHATADLSGVLKRVGGGT